MLPYFTLQQYKSFYYSNGRTIDQMSKPNISLNDIQLKSKHEKYLKKLEKQKQSIERQREKMFNKSSKVDEKWKEVVKQVKERDNNECQLWSILSKYEKESILSTTGYFLLDKVDPAHIFGKGAYPHMKYDPDNIILLSRLLHSRIDHYTDPITDKTITKKEHIDWWIRIVGKQRYDRLLKKSQNKEGV